MRKLIYLLILLIFFHIHFFENADADAITYLSANDFESFWSADELNVDIVRLDNDHYKVLVEMFDHGYEWNEWQYTCIFDDVRQILVSFKTGTKTNYVYDEITDTISETTLYHDGYAEFSIDQEGFLNWKDHTGKEGEGYRLNKMGNFKGTWVFDKYEVDCHIVGLAYRCRIEYSLELEKKIEWNYYCRYDPKTRKLIGDGTGSKEIVSYDDGEIAMVYDVYKDGSAAFSINENGYLIWEDFKEDKGKELCFTRTQPYNSENPR